MTQLGMRTVPVSGFLHAFERDTGNLAWNSHIKTIQYLILDQFQDLPLLFLTARTQNNVNLGAPGMVGGPLVVKVTTLLKSNGKAVFDEQLPANTTNFFGVRVDPRARTVELLSQRLKITHYPKPESAKKGQPAASAPRSESAPTPVALPRAKETRVNRPAFDRARIREIAPPPPG